MENTPLELYETAYRLHYVENRLPEAVGYYEALIKEFPDSNECGYAAIQIQKIKANDLVRILKARGKAVQPLSIIAMVLSVMLMIGFIGASILYLYKTKIDHQRQSLMTRAICRMYTGDYDEALKLLAQVKIIAKGDISPFDMSAAIYRKRRQFSEEKAEYEIFYQLNPNRTAPVETDVSSMVDKPDEVTQLKEGEEPFPSAPSPPVSTIDSPKSPPVTPLAKSTTASEASIRTPKVVPKPHKSAPVKSEKPKSKILTPDSVSYF
jgi:tetratricopeptide (TPR) repeat protein